MRTTCAMVACGAYPAQAVTPRTGGCAGKAQAVSLQALRGVVWESAAATLRLNDEREATREAQNRSLYTRVCTLRESLARQDVALAQMRSSLRPGEEPDEVLEMMQAQQRLARQQVRPSTSHVARCRHWCERYRQCPVRRKSLLAALKGLLLYAHTRTSAPPLHSSNTASWLTLLHPMVESSLRQLVVTRLAWSKHPPCLSKRDTLTLCLGAMKLC
jgi:hypothetical protein